VKKKNKAEERKKEKREQTLDTHRPSSWKALGADCLDRNRDLADRVYQDFAVLDNKAPQTITSFQALGGGEAPTEVIVVIDAVNAKPETICYERNQIDKFLSANGGRLPHPTTFAIFTDADTHIHPGFTTDGNALSASLKDKIVSINRVTPLAGYEGSTDRIQLSLKAMDTIAAYESTRPGRKLVLSVLPAGTFSGARRFRSHLCNEKKCLQIL